MTIDEVSRQYQIPEKVLKEYESWGMDGAAGKTVGVWQYDDTDLERLGLILSLRDMGFESPEVETYMTLVLEGAGANDRKMQMLQKKREGILDEIHFREKKIQYLDYLRYEIRRSQ